MRKAGPGLVLALGAVFFSALCFADRFRVRPSAHIAFGWNLLGAVLGGLLEFFSMSLGFRALTLVALAAYLAVFLLAGRRTSAVVSRPAM